MIKKKCFTKNWIDNFKKQKHLKRINPPVVEKMIHALSLLQQLKDNGLEFTFKGGTSLILLLNKSRRFSVDIDILTTQSRDEVEKVLSGIIDNSHFNEWILQDRRSYKDGVPKAHYEFRYNSELNVGANYVLLDILYEKNNYPKTKNVPIQSEWIDTVDILEVEVPTIESILGDKLTAYAPNTVGIQYGKDKDQEIIKQLFDVGCLFDEAEDLKSVLSSFEKIGTKEIKYRSLEINLNDVLDDIYDTSLLIVKRTKNTTEPDKSNFNDLSIGMRRFEGFLMSETFKIEDAIVAAGKAAYISRRLKTKDLSPLEKFDGQDMSEWIIEGEFNYLNKLKKSRDKSAFFYWYQALNQ